MLKRKNYKMLRRKHRYKDINLHNLELNNNFVHMVKIPQATKEKK